MGGAGLAIIDKAEAGPQFGAEGLSIALQPGRERTAKSRLGSYYARRADGGRSLFGPGEEKGAQLTDLKVRAGSACGGLKVVWFCMLPMPALQFQQACIMRVLATPVPQWPRCCVELVCSVNGDMLGMWLGCWKCAVLPRCLWRRGTPSSGTWTALCGRARAPRPAMHCWQEQ